MSVKLLRGLDGGVDRALARKCASEVARLLGTKVVARPLQVLGRAYAYYPYEVPAHCQDFWCTLHVSDDAYCFKAEHRRKTRAVVCTTDFCVSLKRPLKYMCAARLLRGVSKALGVAVYAQPHHTNAHISRCLLSAMALPALRAIDFRRVKECFVNPIQLEVVASLADPPSCAAQVKALRELVTALFADACRRKAESGSRPLERGSCRPAPRQSNVG